jgi:hypothetical protein
VISGKVRWRTNLKEKERKKSDECREQPCLIFFFIYLFLKQFGEISPKSEIQKLNIRKLGDIGSFSTAKIRDNNSSNNNNRHIFTIGFQL